MKAWFRLLRARTLLLFSATLVLIGAAPVLYFLGLVVGQVGIRLQAGSWVPLPATLLFTDHAPLMNGKAAPLLAFIPELHWPWFASPEAVTPTHLAATWILDRLHVGLIFALAGIALIAIGVLGVVRQKARIRVQRQGSADRLRRARDYRRDASRPDHVQERREPFIGAGSIARNTDRRVA